MKRALVIGGTGFIGLNVVDELLADGVEVRATVRRRSLSIYLRKRPVELRDGSLESPDQLADAMRGVDAVFFTAGHYPRYSLDRQGAIATAVRGTRHVCKAALAAGVPKLVFTSSIASLARAPDGRAADEDDIEPRLPEDSVYRAVKYAMERVVQGFGKKGLDAVTLLPGGCLGPWDVRLGTGAFLVALAAGAMPWYVDGLVHMVDVGDVARAHVAAAKAPAGSRYILAGHPVRVSELFRDVVRRHGGRMPAERLDIDAARRRADAEEHAAAPKRGRVPVPREMVDIIAWGQPLSSERARRDLGFEPRPLAQSIDRAREWLLRYGYMPEATPTNGGPLHVTR